MPSTLKVRIHAYKCSLYDSILHFLLCKIIVPFVIKYSYESILLFVDYESSVEALRSSTPSLPASPPGKSLLKCSINGDTAKISSGKKSVRENTIANAYLPTTSTSSPPVTIQKMKRRMLPLF